jgi:archaellum component FlaC
MLVNWNGFSQTDIDSVKIQLTKPIAKLVIQDLIKFDASYMEIETLQQILKETNSKIDTQNELNTNLRSQIETYRKMLSTKDEQLDTSKSMSEELEKAYKRERRTKKFYQITSAVGGAAILLLLVQ